MSSATSPVNVIVRAGAGAGKTTELVRRTFEFAKQFKKEKGRYPQIVICTYTRKATQELRERMMKKACEEKDFELLKYFSTSQVQISTIHGILSLFLGRFGFRIGLDPRYKIIDENKAVQMAKDLVRTMYASGTYSDEEKAQLIKNLGVKNLADLCREYYEASLFNPDLKTHDENSLVQIAKEYEIKCLEDIKRVQAEWQELAAPQESVERVNKILVTLNNLNNIIRGQGILEGRDLLLEVLEDIPTLSFGKNKELFFEAIESLKEFRGDFKKELEKPAFNKINLKGAAQFFVLCERFFKEFTTQFKEKKKLLGQIEISDLELLSLECIRVHPETALLFSMEWDYWLIDEYQDTSPVQVEILNHLVGKVPHFVVGDPQQSIYLFRGARSEVFAAKEKSIVDSGGEHLLLKKNYRSDKKLVLFFNCLFGSIDNTFTSLESHFQDTAEDELAATISLTGKDEGYLSLCHHIKNLLSKNVAPEDICILARDNKSLKAAAKSLSKVNVPSLLHSASGFYERREILDALALLKFILNPYDDINLVQLIRSPWFWLSDQIIMQVLRPRDGKKSANSAWEMLLKSPLSNKEAAILRLTDILVARDLQALSTLFRQTLLDLGFFDFAQRQDVTGRREANLWKFILNLERSSRESGFNFIDFVTQSEREIDLENAREQDAASAREVNRVNLMTVHQSKGLEFPYVILLDIHRSPPLTNWLPMSIDEDLGRFSLRLFNSETNDKESSLGCLRWVNRLKERELEESKRLLYVALTRAEKNLTLIGESDFKKGSWGKLITWDLGAGEHKMEGFRYFVDKGPWTVDKIVETYSAPIKVREKFVAEKSVNPLVSVSEIVKKDFKREPSRGLSRSHLLNRASSISTGIQVHRILELLRYSPNGIDETLIKKMFPERAQEIFAALDFLRKLDVPPLSKVINSGFAEWGYLFKDGEQIIEGQIDLWGEVGSEAWIIDYKTGSPEFKETARLQLQEYARALKAYGVKKPIRLAAIYPLSKEVAVF